MQRSRFSRHTYLFVLVLASLTTILCSSGTRVAQADGGGGFSDAAVLEDLPEDADGRCAEWTAQIQTPMPITGTSMELDLPPGCGRPESKLPSQTGRPTGLMSWRLPSSSVTTSVSFVHGAVCDEEGLRKKLSAPGMPLARCPVGAKERRRRGG